MIQDPRQEAVEADRVLMRAAVELLRSPHDRSKPDALSALGQLHQFLDDIIIKSVERVRFQDAAHERPSLTGTETWTEYADQRVSLTLLTQDSAKH